MSIETLQFQEASLEQETAQQEKHRSYALTVVALLFLCSLVAVGFLVLKTTQLQKEISIVRQEAIQNTTQEVVSQPKNSEEEHLVDIDTEADSTSVEPKLNFIRVCNSGLVFQSPDPFPQSSKECLRFTTGAVSREIYTNGFQVSDERIELAQEAQSTVTETVSTAYKTLTSDTTREYMSRRAFIPTTGGVRSVEVHSLIPSSNQASEVSIVISETKLTYYLHTFYPEKNDIIGTAIQDAVEDLLTYDPQYVEDEL